MPEAIAERDRALLFSSVLLRSLVTSAVAILAGVYFPKLGLDKRDMGIVLGVGLAGNAVAAIVATTLGDRLGRRKLLAAVGGLGALGGAVLAFVAEPRWLAVAAFVGMLNGMGRDRGAAMIVEQAILPSTATDATRTKTFAWYNVLADAGHAIGGWLAAAVALGVSAGLTLEGSQRVVVLACALLLVPTVPLALALSDRVELAATERRPLSPEAKRVVAKLAALFGLDSLGGGFLTTAWLAAFFQEQHGTGELGIGALFFGARVLNAFSHLGAAWLAKRIGLVNTMVFTHVPSSLLLLVVVNTDSFVLAAALFLVREGLSQMDVPTRQSYLMAVVRPEERVAASGVTQLVRMGAWVVAPIASGFIAKGVSPEAPFVIGAVLKLLYDGLLWIACRKARPPEERGP